MPIGPKLYGSVELERAHADVVAAQRELLRAGYSTKSEWLAKPKNRELSRRLNRAARRFNDAQRKLK